MLIIYMLEPKTEIGHCPKKKCSEREWIADKIAKSEMLLYFGLGPITNDDFAYRQIRKAQIRKFNFISPFEDFKSLTLRMGS